MKPVANLVGLLLLFSALSIAQIRGTPASVTSMGSGFSQTPGIPASVTSLGPNGFGPAIGVRGSFGQKPRVNLGIGFNNFHRSRAFPVYVPVYVYPYTYPVVPYLYEPHSIDDPVIQSGAQQDYTEPERRGVTIFEPGYRPSTAPRADSRNDSSDSSRYGEHYLDSREDRAKRPSDDASSVRVIPGPKATAPETHREAEAVEDVPTTVLVFKDGHRVEVHNYAIIGGTLWDLGEHFSKKISLADLDLDVTTRLNDERGIPFKLPRKN
jgi:hypothetical protein